MIGNYNIPWLSIESGAHALRSIDSFMTQVVASFLQFANQESSVVRGVLNDQKPEFFAQRTPGPSRTGMTGWDRCGSESIVWKQLAPDKQRTQGQQTSIGKFARMRDYSQNAWRMIAKCGVGTRRSFTTGLKSSQIGPLLADCLMA
jgi:hypothetical protein